MAIVEACRKRSSARRASQLGGVSRFASYDEADDEDSSGSSSSSSSSSSGEDSDSSDDDARPSAFASMAGKRAKSPRGEPALTPVEMAKKRLETTERALTARFGRKVTSRSPRGSGEFHGQERSGGKLAKKERKKRAKKRLATAKKKFDRLDAEKKGHRVVVIHASAASSTRPPPPSVGMLRNTPSKKEIFQREMRKGRAPPPMSFSAPGFAAPPAPPVPTDFVRRRSVSINAIIKARRRASRMG